MLKICFLAPSEYGKNTAVKLLSTKYKIQNIKIAEPLYLLQDSFYRFIGKKMTGEQDGELLQYLGKKIRQENPDFLVQWFFERLKEFENFDGIISNDDCRPPDYKFLKDCGFVFIKINGFKRDRLDHTKADPNSSLEWHKDIKCDYVVDNLGSIEEYKQNLFELLKKIMSKKGL